VIIGDESIWGLDVLSGNCNKETETLLGLDEWRRGEEVLDLGKKEIGLMRTTIGSPQKMCALRQLLRISLSVEAEAQKMC